MEKQSHIIKTEIVVSLVLRYGVIFCGLVIAFGLLLRALGAAGSASVSSGGGAELIRQLMNGATLSGFVPLHTLGDFESGFAHLEPDAVMAAGLLLLILLPVARVGMTVLLFLLERDWPFFFITSFVFLILLGSLRAGSAL